MRPYPPIHLSSLIAQVVTPDCVLIRNAHAWTGWFRSSSSWSPTGATWEEWGLWLIAPLEYAAAKGNFEMVEKLLKAGADGSSDWRGSRGRTLLDAAALGGNADVVSALINAGCTPDARERLVT